MSITKEHELHKRRFGRNAGLGLTLLAFVVLVFLLTVVKVNRPPADSAAPAAAGQEAGQ